MKPFNIAALAAAALLAGCASVAVTDDLIVQRTAFALSLQPNEFTISNRSDSGVRTDYTVTTRTGRTFQCYVGGSVSVVGRVVSDAICSPMGGGAAAGNPAPTGTAQPPAANAPGCNALLRAAGRC